ncbi:primosomal protein N' [Lutibaculum baratangense]|uniref:primosomal protein N' n=1 Tax=Lutibaculum baratangense TaxID=1358440 RepID=UPI00058C9F82
MPRTVNVLVTVALERTYTYAVPDGLSLRVGDVVVVPFGPRLMLGVVWEGVPEPIDGKKLKAVERKLDGHLDATMRRFVSWVADYTVTPPGQVLRMVLRVPGALLPEKPVLALRLAGPPPDRLTEARRRVLDVLGHGEARTKAALAEAARVSTSVVDGLVEAGTLRQVELPPEPLVPPPDPDRPHKALTESQEEAAEALSGPAAEGGFEVTLLEGVTGSGKTEVYFEAVAAALKAGRQVLVLVPEISLTGQFLERFEARFGARPAEWHSDATPKARERTWRGVASGEVRAVAGARSALFLPFRELGLIVVDEEHDPAYKQEDGVIYNARDMAVVRGMLSEIPVVLSSATPSVESRANAQKGRYRHITLHERFAMPMPDITAIDMRTEGPERGRWLAPALVKAIAEETGHGRQALLFLNRRGYAPLTLCRKCGYRFECPNCSAWLVEHRFRGTLACHHCGFETGRPDKCPNCAAEHSLVPCGPGVERVAEEAMSLFPDRRVLILSSDVVASLADLRERFAVVERGEADIVIGTQLVAKGHNFPHLSVVGVVDADLGLASADPRAAERTFQLLQQVTGRAGRGLHEGRAFVQTFEPSHPVMAAIVSGDKDGFYERELEARARQGLPPFGRLAALVVSANAREQAVAHAKAMALAVPSGDVRVLGPADAPLAVIRGRHRLRFLVKAPRGLDMAAFIRAWLSASPKPAGNVRVSVDIDPVSFL